jgi:molybdate transport system ATP-binding protein
MNSFHLDARLGGFSEVRGPVELAGRRLDVLPARARRIGWVPQDASLFPHLTVRDNVAFGARRPDLIERAVAALEIAPLLDRRASGLSGGERQRAAIARALASEPCFLLLDEPLASIDRPLRARVVPFLQELPARTGVPMLVVTHDPLEVAVLADHVLVLEGGRIVRTGAPPEVFASPVEFGSLLALTAENRFAGRVGRRGPGTLEFVTAGGCRVAMAWVDGFPEPARIAVRSEDVLLAVERPTGISAQNVLEGAVDGTEISGGQVVVLVRCAGDQWRARITERAGRELGIRPGLGVHLVFKAHAVHPVA